MKIVQQDAPRTDGRYRFCRWCDARGWVLWDGRDNVTVESTCGQPIWRMKCPKCDGRKVKR